MRRFLMRRLPSRIPSQLRTTSSPSSCTSSSMFHPIIPSNAPPMAMGGQPPLYIRRTFEAMCPVESFKVAGVTFEGRQEVVKSLKSKQAVMLLRAPWNIHDDQAVAVHTLSGQLIGWVPRADNGRFQQHEVIFGRVEFVGTGPSGGDPSEGMPWGVRVVAQPALMPALVSPFPRALLPAANVSDPMPPSMAATPPPPRMRTTARSKASASSSLSAAGTESSEQGGAVASGLVTLERAVGPSLWKEMSLTAKQISRGLCEVTGAGPAMLGGQQLEMAPVWQYCDDRRVVKLVRLALVSPEVSMAHHGLDLPLGTKERRVAVNALQAINNWTLEEVQEHWDAALGQRRLLLQEKWTLDLQGSHGSHGSG